MNEFGEPNMGNPSVRFDEGRERGGHWPSGLSTHPLPPTLQPCSLCYLLFNCMDPAQPGQPSSRRRAHNSRGFRIPTGVMMPVIKSAGVTSKPGFNAPLVGLATRT